MLKFEDTKLLRHPTVEKAYNVMRTFFKDGDDFALAAIRAGEIISAQAKNPDPDAIAASVLMNGMVIAYEPGQFEASVSPGAAEYLRKLYLLDIDNPKFTTAGEQQILLAQSMIGLEGVQEKIDSGEVNHLIEYRNVQQVLDANERALAAIARKATEKDMLAAAQTQLAAAQQSLLDIATESEKAIAFENAGLPDHPTVRAVYEDMKTWALDGDPLGGYTRTNAAIARVIVETGASSDPEVISAALLNQYSTIRKGHKKPSDFSPRIGELWEETSPWADLGGKRADTTPKAPEARTITNAAILHFLESALKADAAYFAKHKTIYPEALEQLEDLKKKIDTAAASEPHDALRARMEKAAQAADAFMNAPEAVKIRKPGSPRIDNW